MTPEEKPTTPVAPKMMTLVPLRVRFFFSFSTFSTQATMAAAVVKEPAGSAKIEISNGLSSAPLALSIMSRARIASLPAKKTAVFTASRGERENMASWTSGITSSSVTFT